MKRNKKMTMMKITMTKMKMKNRNFKRMKKTLMMVTTTEMIIIVIVMEKYTLYSMKLHKVQNRKWMAEIRKNRVLTNFCIFLWKY